MVEILLVDELAVEIDLHAVGGKRGLHARGVALERGEHARDGTPRRDAHGDAGILCGADGGAGVLGDDLLALGQDGAVDIGEDELDHDGPFRGGRFILEGTTFLLKGT